MAHVVSLVVLLLMLCVVCTHTLSVRFTEPPSMAKVANVDSYSRILGTCSRDADCTGVKKDAHGKWAMVHGRPEGDGADVVQLNVI